MFQVSGGSWQNLPATASSALPATAQHVQYLHHQMAPRPPRDATPYPFPHLPYSRGSLGHAAALQQVVLFFPLSSLITAPLLLVSWFLHCVAVQFKWRLTDGGLSRLWGGLADATTVRVQPWVRPARQPPRRDLVGDDDEAAAATHADAAAAAADVAVPCVAVPGEAGRYAFPGVRVGGGSGLARHFVIAAADGHACSPGVAVATTAAADGAFLRAVSRWQAAAAAEVDVAGLTSAAADQLIDIIQTH